MDSIKATQIFTPPWVTNQMLDMLDQEHFQAEDTFFFEPSCGDGGMLVVILERIYKALLSKHHDMPKAIAETLHKFYAIELDVEMVQKCRVNVWNWVLEKLGDKPDFKLLCDFLIANQIKDAVEHNNFFVVMEESKKGTLTRKNKRRSLVMKNGTC